MNKNVLAIVIILIVATGGFWYFSTNNQSSDTMMNKDSIMTDGHNSDEIMATSTDEMIINSHAKVFTAVGSNFKYSVNEIKVKKGDTVRIMFKNGGGFHDWNLDEFNVDGKVIETGEEETLEFVADKTGEFEYYCSVGNHRQMGMLGKFIVEE